MYYKLSFNHVLIVLTIIVFGWGMIQFFSIDKRIEKIDSQLLKADRIQETTSIANTTEDLSSSLVSNKTANENLLSSSQTKIAWSNDEIVYFSDGKAKLLSEAFKNIDYMADNEVFDKLLDIMNIKEEEVPLDIPIREYVKRLLEIATNENRLFDDDKQAQEIMFDPILPDGTKIIRTDKDEKIFSYFDTSEYDGKQVFVKWFKEGSSEPILFDFYDIHEDSRIDRIWIPKTGQEVGDYSVEIYSTYDMKILADGQYSIDQD